MTSRPGDDLASVREQLDRLDDRLIDLVRERAELVRRIAVLKRATGRPILDPDREVEITERMRRRAAGLPEAELSALIERLRELMRKVAGG